MANKISIKNARVHNLKNISLDIPRDKLVVITGLSGSGKSSLAFDALYAEGQRRYVESLSTYARQFLDVMEKPDVEQITGLSPTIAIDQKNVARNPRSTVGTITEIYDHLRLLYARLGQPHCPQCQQPVTRQSVKQIICQIKKQAANSSFYILAPLIREQKGQHRNIITGIANAGYSHLRLDGVFYDVKEATDIKIDNREPHTIEIVINQFDKGKVDDAHLASIVETALELGNGLVAVHSIEKKEDVLYSQLFNCSRCNVNISELDPRHFSFNSPYGACPKCSGLGTKLEVDPDLIIPNEKLTLAQGAIRPWSSSAAGQQNKYLDILEALTDKYDFSLHTMVKDLAPADLEKILSGTKKETIKVRDESGQEKSIKFKGVLQDLADQYRQTDSDYIRSEIERYMRVKQCPTCQGKRLNEIALGVTVAGQTIDSITSLTIAKALTFFKQLPHTKQFTAREKKITSQIFQEIISRLNFLQDVGLEYLTLDRGANSLAGGEAQRIKLATQIGLGLVGIIYVLDEPSIGLHQRDVAKLISTLKELRDLHNSVIVVEHDTSTILAADHVIDIGPGAGKYGGEVIFTGTPSQLKKHSKSLTGQYLAAKKKIAVPSKHRPGNDKKITIKKAAEYNLKDVTVDIPLAKLVCVTGVSGSGKSTLIDDVLGRALSHKFHRAKALPGKHESITGLEHINKVVRIDQSPIGRTPRSNPATYTGMFNYIRDLFAQTPEAKMHGYKAGKFSFNVRGGRCEACQGDGFVKIDMNFLADVYVECDECHGKRYGQETLEIHYRGKNIAEVLAMTINEALTFFSTTPSIKQKLKTLQNVGLGYLQLGQPATTLSGGEAQRIKLATELSRRATGKTLYILDEPTTGLHFDDIKKLLGVLNKLVDASNTVLVIEHNLDVIKCADWVIDLGPEGGAKGGYVVAEGTPREITKCEKSYTGKYLKKCL
ncbi:MAG: excinuclease ABC subunit UvrA [Parcubacteria group bacterium]|nr:excinuclease ABC subunit UvrA [Parcubacteria group bacterium]